MTTSSVVGRREVKNESKKFLLKLRKITKRDKNNKATTKFMAKKKTVVIVIRTESGKEMRIRIDEDTHRDYQQLSKQSGIPIEEYIAQVLINAEKEKRERRRF